MNEDLRERAGVMNRVLTAARAVDPRRSEVEAEQCILWAKLIDVRYSEKELMWAVEQHHRRSGEFLDTHRLQALVADRRRDILSRAGECPFPDGLDQRQERAFRAEWQAALFRGADRATAFRLACNQVGVRAVEHRPKRAKELTRG